MSTPAAIFDLSVACAGDETAVIDKAKQGNRDAQSHLFRTYHAAVFRYAYRRTENEDAARDVVQATFIRVFAKLKRLRKNSSFRAYLYRAAERACCDYWRKENRMLRDVAIARTPEPALLTDSIETKQQKRVLYRALRELPAKQKLVVELRIFEQLSFKEIATVMKVSANTARVNYHHGVKKLKEAVFNANR